jgi:hypothetical protein
MVGVGNVGGGDRRGKRQPTAVADQVQLAPRLAAIDGICAHMVPRVWRARSWCPRLPATSPAGPARPAGPTPPSAERRTPRHWPTRRGGASRSTASRSRAPGRAAATGWRCAPCTRSRRSRPDPGWRGVGRRTVDGAGSAAAAAPAPTARRARGRQQEPSWRASMPHRTEGSETTSKRRIHLQVTVRGRAGLKPKAIDRSQSRGLLLDGAHPRSCPDRKPAGLRAHGHDLTLRPLDGLPTITKIALVTAGKVPGIDEAASSSTPPPRKPAVPSAEHFPVYQRYQRVRK